MSTDGFRNWLERLFRGRTANDSDTDDGEREDERTNPLDGLKTLPKRELRTRTHKAEQRFKNVRADIEHFDDDLQKLEANYTEATSEIERKQVAMVMRVTKQKRAVKEVKEKLALRDMLKYTYAAGVSEIESIVHDEIAREDPISKYRSLSEGTVEEVPDLADQVDTEIEELTRAFDSFEQPLAEAGVDVAATATGTDLESLKGFDFEEDPLETDPTPDLDLIDPFDHDRTDAPVSTPKERSGGNADSTAGGDAAGTGDERETSVVRE